MIFYLGTHQPRWLARAGVPLFVSHRRLDGRKSLPRAVAPWALDSGGFSELSMFGSWQTTPASYVAAARRYADEIGLLDWVAIQDWMCEPFMLEKTGLGIAEHQRRTVDSFLRLRDAAPELPWAPVLQGWRRDDYLRCADAYEAAGVDLRAQKIVGLGGVCRRQATDEAAGIIRTLAVGRGLALHGFGLKMQGLAKAGVFLASSDSMAWSFSARRQPPMPGHEARHSNCANCINFALEWRERLLSAKRRPAQLDLALEAA